MPQMWRLYLYKRKRDGASIEQLQDEFGIPAEEIKTRLEAARLCFEKQCLVAGPSSLAELERPRTMAAGGN